MMMSKVRTLILRAPGTNCDVETAFAFERAGAVAELVHINRFAAGEAKLSGYQILVIPGGFTYGDDISAGRILANELKLRLGEEMGDFVSQGKLVLGICNGFQVLMKAGVLPDPGSSAEVTLAANDSNRFECRWVYLKVNPQSPCVFTKGIDRMYLPAAHAEGKLVASEAALKKVNAALYYTDAAGNTGSGYPHNPNGSADDIAGISDASGRIFALMPHPERHIHPTQHPRWTREDSKEHGDGFKIFVNAVEWARGL